MKINIFVAAFFNTRYCTILNLDDFDFDVNNKYEQNHTNCNNYELEIMNLDLQCEIINQHKVCSTTCNGGKRNQFKCDCNRQVKVITIFDINACHWKPVIDTPCPQTQPPTILNNLNIDASAREKIEIEKQEITSGENFIYNQLVEETKLIANSVENINTNDAGRGSHCTTLDEYWNCSNSNISRSLCVRSCEMNPMLEMKKCVCQPGLNCEWEIKGSKCPQKPIT